MNHEKYKRFECVACGYTWLGFAKKPRCRKCKSKKINILPANVDVEYLEELYNKAEGKKIIKKYKKTNPFQTIEKKETNVKSKMEEIKKEFDENLFYGGVDVETPKKQEEDREIVYKCSACGGETIRKGDLFCKVCGSALNIDWNNL